MFMAFNLSMIITFLIANNGCISDTVTGFTVPENSQIRFFGSSEPIFFTQLLIEVANISSEKPIITFTTFRKTLLTKQWCGIKGNTFFSFVFKNNENTYKPWKFKIDKILMQLFSNSPHLCGEITNCTFMLKSY